MWVVIYVAKGKQEADKITQLLTAEGFLARVHKVGKKSSETDSLYEISVTEIEAKEAQSVMCKGGF